MTDRNPGEGNTRVRARWAMPNECLPAIEEVLHDPTASFWLKHALRSALERDPVDAANEAEILAQLLVQRCLEITGRTNSK
jgi:hypothetical protein